MLVPNKGKTKVGKLKNVQSYKFREKSWSEGNALQACAILKFQKGIKMHFVFSKIFTVSKFSHEL